MSERSAYVAIMEAAERGRGLRLTAKEVLALSRDDAVESRASYEVDRTLGATGPWPGSWRAVARLMRLNGGATSV